MSEAFLIWGAGAIGGTVGAYLARAGEHVVFIDRDAEHVDAIARDGLSIEGPIDNFTVRAASATPEVLQGTFRRVLLCVKAQHTAEATSTLLPHLAPDGYVASFQNGLCEYEIAKQTGQQRVVGAFLNFGADYLGPGRIHFGGRGAVVLGELDGKETARVRKLHEAMRHFEPRAVLSQEIVSYLWGKLGYGALLFATALTDDPIADVLGDSNCADLLARVAGEVMDVAARRGVSPRGFDGFDPVSFRPGADPLPSLAAMTAHNRRSAKTHSGVWRDLAVRRRPTEVDAQLGAVAAAGRELGVPTPLLDRLTAMIHEIERGERPLDRANLAALAA